jgi:hypothetical protein
MPRKKLSGPVKAERAAIVAFLEHIGLIALEKAELCARTGDRLADHYTGRGDALRTAAYSIKTGMHHRVSPTKGKDQ